MAEMITNGIFGDEAETVLDGDATVIVQGVFQKDARVVFSMYNNTDSQLPTVVKTVNTPGAFNIRSQPGITLNAQMQGDVEDTGTDVTITITNAADDLVMI